MLRYRSHPTAAHVAPLAVFLLLGTLASLVEVKNSALPWWRSAPEHWVYPLQTLAGGAALAFFWRHYTFRPIRGLGWATVLAVVGIGAWVLPSWLYTHVLGGGCGPWDVPWLGLVPRAEGFDPTLFGASGPAFALVLALRFARMVLVVPLVEEIFWRGFLMRWLVAGDERPFWKVPIGTHTWKAFGVTTAAFMLVHAKEDWLGALVFGSLMYGLSVRTKSLAACVWMHAVANLLLGVYVLKTRQWGFW